MRVTFYLKTVSFEHQTSQRQSRKASYKEIAMELRPGDE